MFKDRIFNLAILISVAWHIFWLSMITVVVTPKETGQVKFSKVSFLGPILERGALEVRIKPRERSLLEKRHLVNIGNLTALKVDELVYQKGWHLTCPSDEKLTGLIEDAVSGPKLEPPLEIY